MKKLIFIISIIITASGFAQSLFDKYEDVDQVNSVIVTDEMFKLLKEIEPESAEAKEEISVLSNLTGLKVFSTGDTQAGQNLLHDAQTYADGKKMVELMRINDEDAKVKFYIVKGSQPHIAKELVMLLQSKKPSDHQVVVMVVTGNIDLKKLSKLNKKVKIVNGKYFEKIEEQESK